MTPLTEFVAGALTMAYVLAGFHFVRFWRRTHDRLFLHFAVAFWLFAVNQFVTALPRLSSTTGGVEYVLRVLGFIWIIIGVVDKNAKGRDGRNGAARTPSAR